ncbi:solute carrier family 22 member 13 [Solea solea]|uniref:solute carrier family 22 member 13 n=1 Tax=Solea solea TaxID=90069 RepID=UPI00272BBCD1|nr:solute carrier family 22 member 13 [Solea solea]
MSVTEEILSTIGDFGFFQKMLLFGFSFQFFLFSTLFSHLVFFQSDPDRHCNTDWILAADSNLTADEQLDLTLPREENGTFSQCRMFVPVDWNISVIRQHRLNETTGCLNGWVYYNTQYKATIVTDFDFVCDMSLMPGFVQTVFMAGSAVGAFIFGPLAQSYGRRRSTQLPAVLMLIFVLVMALSPNYSTYLVAEFMLGISFAGLRMNSVLLATEWIGGRRSLATCICQLSSSVGQIAVVVLIYFVRDWRVVQYILTGMQAVVFVYIWWIPESARWLLEKGRFEEANEIIRRVAKVNKRSVPEDLLLLVSERKKVHNGGIKMIFTSKILMKYLLIVSFVSFSLNLSIFSINLNVGKFGVSIFLVHSLFGIFDIPAHCLCLWFLERGGRKTSQALTALAGGILCMSTVVFPQDNAAVITAIVTMGRFFLSWGISVNMVYAQELFPTSVRQAAFGLVNTFLRLAGPLSALLNMLSIFHQFIPIVVFSSLLIVSGALVILLPETRDKDLPDSEDFLENNRSDATKQSGRVFNTAENNGIEAT